MKKLIKVSGILLIMITFFASCSKDDEVVPDYVGTWTNSEVDSSGIASMQTLVLTVNTFDLKMSMDMLGQQFTLGEGKGDFTVTGNQVKMTLKEMGILDFQTGVMNFYSAGTPEFESSLDGGSATMTGEYSVAGNKLTLKTDDDANGSYSADEIQVFTKK